jgi:signal peptidase I
MARKKISLVRWTVSFIIMVPLIFIWIMFLSGRWMSYEIISASMSPTLEVGDCVIMKREADFDNLKDQIIAFRDPKDKDVALTKRVVAEQNSRVQLWNGTVYVDGQQIAGEPIENVDNKRWEVGAGEVFVLGDNRNNSTDSIDYGPIPRSSILGVITYRYWPFHRRGRILQRPG